MVGGRLGYVLFYKPEMLRDPLSILRVWEGGMSSHGGIIGLGRFSRSTTRASTKCRGRTSATISCVVAPIGLFFGRCANFINGELYGRAANVSWAVQFPKELLEPENAAEADRAMAACAADRSSLTTPGSDRRARSRSNPQIAKDLARRF